MTTKKSKNYDLNKKAQPKYKPEDTKKKSQNTKKIDTFLPINQGNNQKETGNTKQ